MFWVFSFERLPTNERHTKCKHGAEIYLFYSKCIIYLLPCCTACNNSSITICDCECRLHVMTGLKMSWNLNEMSTRPEIWNCSVLSYDSVLFYFSDAHCIQQNLNSYVCDRDSCACISMSSTVCKSSKHKALHLLVISLFAFKLRTLHNIRQIHCLWIVFVYVYFQISLSSEMHSEHKYIQLQEMDPLIHF